MTAQYKFVQEPKRVVAAIVCNGCGKRVVFGSDGFHCNEIHPFSTRGGYASTYPRDCETISFHLCGGCLAAIVRRFKVMPTFGAYMPGVPGSGGTEDMDGAQAWFALLKCDTSHEHVKAAQASNDAMLDRRSAMPPVPTAVCFPDEFATDADRAMALGTYDDWVLLPLSEHARIAAIALPAPMYWYGDLPLPALLPEAPAAEGDVDG